MTKREALDEAISEALFSSRFASDPDVRIDGIRKAILAELRVPDERMIHAGEQAVVRVGVDDFVGGSECVTMSAALSSAEVRTTLQAMIDAIE